MPRSWLTLQHSPVLLSPPCSRGFTATLQIFLLWKQPTLFSSQMWWVLEGFFPFWQVLAARGELTECQEDPSRPGCDWHSRRQLLPLQGNLGFVCGLTIMLPPALRNPGNFTLLFSSQVHALRDVPALEADDGRTFKVSDVQLSSLTAESASLSMYFSFLQYPWETEKDFYCHFFNAEVGNAISKFSEDACGQRISGGLVFQVLFDFPAATTSPIRTDSRTLSLALLKMHQVHLESCCQSWVDRNYPRKLGFCVLYVQQNAFSWWKIEIKPISWDVRRFQLTC